MVTQNKNLALVCPWLAACNVLLAVPAQAQDVSFEPARNYLAGSYPLSVAVGDFNADGVVDLVVANSSGIPNDVSVLLGRGDGSFEAALNFAAGGFPVAVVVCDFNGDGRLDLAVANWETSKVSVFLGSGDGGFRSAGDFEAGTSPQSIAVGDFNGDGWMDLAVANHYAKTVMVLLGNGDGTFQAGRSFRAGDYPNSISVGDFNGDGRLDLAVANWGSGNVSVLLGVGDGSFQAARTFVAGDQPASLATSMATARRTSRWLTLIPATSRCFWETEMGAFGRRNASELGSIHGPLRWATSMATGSRTSLWPTTIPTMSRSF